jgi:hypothetical protein
MKEVFCLHTARRLQFAEKILSGGLFHVREIVVWLKKGSVSHLSNPVILRRALRGKGP